MARRSVKMLLKLSLSEKKLFGYEKRTMLVT
jgi:hypothetical protein